MLENTRNFLTTRCFETIDAGHAVILNYEYTYEGTGYFIVKRTESALKKATKDAAGTRIGPTIFYERFVVVTVTPDGKGLFLVCSCGLYQRCLVPCVHLMVLKNGVVDVTTDVHLCSFKAYGTTDLLPVQRSFEDGTSSGPALTGMDATTNRDIDTYFKVADGVYHTPSDRPNLPEPVVVRVEGLQPGMPSTNRTEIKATKAPTSSSVYTKLCEHATSEFNAVANTLSTLPAAEALAKGKELISECAADCLRRAETLTGATYVPTGIPNDGPRDDYAPANAPSSSRRTPHAGPHHKNASKKRKGIAEKSTKGTNKRNTNMSSSSSSSSSRSSSGGSTIPIPRSINSTSSSSGESSSRSGVPEPTVAPARTKKQKKKSAEIAAAFNFTEEQMAAAILEPHRDAH
jgi:hypothetical protein